ncbi:MAG: endolytic transglycosylase MltG [Wujia sp.]
MVEKIIKLVKVGLLFLAVFSLGAIVYDYAKGFYDEYMEEYKGTESYEGEDVVVEIPQGASVKKVASILKENGLIKYEAAFIKRYQNEFKGKINDGTYTLNTGMTTLQMMEAMRVDDTVPEKIDVLVIPEGFTIDLIAARCENQGICTAEEFINAVESVTTSDFPYLADVPIGADVKYRLEGYLFPATYDIYNTTTAESLVEDMTNAFDNYFSEEFQARMEELGYNSYDVITRASIVEREAKVDEERAIIAGVIENRLKIGMQLQMCPTVLYPLTDGLYDKQQVLYTDLELDSPYNTYKYTGLPVGPICNPGLACIEAVLYPAEHSYLYYHVADEETGTHVFSETYQDHIDTQIIGGPNGVNPE